MKKSLNITLLLAGLVISVGFYPILGHSCGDFQIVTNDSTVINGRSMEFGLDLNGTQFLVYPRGEQTVSHTPEGKKGMVWTSKYGFIGLGVKLKELYGDCQLIDDGMNEMGLSAGGLVFREAKYENVSESDANKTLDNTDFIPWLLGNFASVDEVKEALSGIHIWGMEKTPANPYVLGIHFAIHDSQGKNIVVEFVNGEMKIYDNPIGVMTNSPSFDYQITNLRNYVNLNPKSAQSIDLHGVRINTTGEGSGSLGMPGDFTPPHRFVRLALFTSWINRPQNASEGVNAAVHLLNTVDIPKGVNKGDGVLPSDYTEWAVIKDLTNKVLYFRTYDNPTLRCVDIKKFDLKPGAGVKSIPIVSQEGVVIDVTNEFR